MINGTLSHHSLMCSYVRLSNPLILHKCIRDFRARRVVLYFVTFATYNTDVSDVSDVNMTFYLLCIKYCTKTLYLPNQTIKVTRKLMKCIMRKYCK